MNNNCNSLLRFFRSPLWAAMVIAASMALCPYTVNADDSKKPYSSISVVDSVLTTDSTLVGKVVYVDFWASWCAPCRASFPWMNRLAKKYHDQGLRVVTVNLDKSQEPALKFLEELGNNLSVIFDSTGSLAKMYEIDAMPTSFLYNRQGLLNERHRGFRPSDTTEIVKAISDLLNEDNRK